MEQSLLERAVGLVLALLFAGAMGLSIAGVLLADYMEPGRLMTAQARRTVFFCGLAGGFAGLVSWWMQQFAARRGIVIRFFYGFFVFLLVFGAAGGIFEAVRNLIFNPGPKDLTPSGIYWASVSAFYTFALFLVVPLRIALFAVFLASGVILALVGPRERS